MTILFPRLPRAASELLFSQVESLTPAFEHRGQIFSPVGGRRASPADVASLSERVHALASEFGFPGPTTQASRLAFDQRTARLLVEIMELSWSEAAAPDMWSFVALVALPDITRWRFGTSNVERWIASDLTRHTWARAWWRGTVFAGRHDLLDLLTESDLNQILERRVIGGDPRLVTGIAEAVLDGAADFPGLRRTLIRDSAARLRRRLAFIDARSLDDLALDALCRELVSEAAEFSPREGQSQGGGQD